MSQQYDVIVVGAGHNGLLVAAYMAKAGLKTLVLEKEKWLGGARCLDSNMIWVAQCTQQFRVILSSPMTNSD